MCKCFLSIRYFRFEMKNSDYCRESLPTGFQQEVTPTEEVGAGLRVLHYCDDVLLVLDPPGTPDIPDAASLRRVLQVTVAHLLAVLGFPRLLHQLINPDLFVLFD